MYQTFYLLGTEKKALEGRIYTIYLEILEEWWEELENRHLPFYHITIYFPLLFSSYALLSFLSCSYWYRGFFFTKTADRHNFMFIFFIWENLYLPFFNHHLSIYYMYKRVDMCVCSYKDKILPYTSGIR